MEEIKLVDSNVFIHAFIKPKKNITSKETEIKKKSMEIVKNIQKGKFKVLLTTAQIFEVVNIIESWLGHEASKDMVDFIITRHNVKIYPVSQKDLENALEVSEQYKSNKIGFNDCVTYVVMKNSEISEILSFDKHFDQFPDITRLEG